MTEIEEELTKAFEKYPTLVDRSLRGEMLGGNTPLAVRTQANWDCAGKFNSEMPPIKIGHSVRYRKTDVIAFLARRIADAKGIQGWQAPL